MNKEQNAPHIRLHGRGESPHLDLFIALLPLAAFSAVYYGWRPVLVVLCGTVSAVLTELLSCLLMHRRPTLQDGNALYIGTAIGALMSPMTAYWVPAIGAAFAILVVKMPFGGNGKYVFQPVAAAMALISQCMAGTVYVYPDIGAALPLAPKAAFAAKTSPAAQLLAGGNPQIGRSDLLLGNFAGPIGATAIGLLLACLLYLLIRKAVSGWTVLPYLAVCTALFWLFPRTEAPAVQAVVLELSSGYLLFAGIFLLGDPTTSPRNTVSRVAFGALAGVLTVLLRYYGRFEDGGAFAILLLSPLSSVMDRAGWLLARQFRRRDG